MTPISHNAFAAFVGIDWADAKHDVCLQTAGSAKRAYFQLEPTPEAIDAWVTTLRRQGTAQGSWIAPSPLIRSSSLGSPEAHSSLRNPNLRRISALENPPSAW
jgi:hypothetical protein